ncbi:MAG: hypothetical protein ABH880_02085 [Patescibacteria group bacterium]
MTSRPLLIKIEMMLRVRKLCLYLNDFIKNRSLDGYKLEFQVVLRNGIRIEEEKKFIEYISQKDKNIDMEKLKDEIEDCIKREFFEVKKFPYSWLGQTDLIRLGWRGRKLVGGGPISKWAYFFQFAYAEHSFLYATLLGMGIFAFIDLFWKFIVFIGHNFLSFLLM